MAGAELDNMKSELIGRVNARRNLFDLLPQIRENPNNHRISLDVARERIHSTDSALYGLNRQAKEQIALLDINIPKDKGWAPFVEAQILINILGGIIRSRDNAI